MPRLLHYLGPFTVAHQELESNFCVFLPECAKKPSTWQGTIQTLSASICGCSEVSASSQVLCHSCHRKPIQTSFSFQHRPHLKHQALLPLQGALASSPTTACPHSFLLPLDLVYLSGCPILSQPALLPKHCSHLLHSTVGTYLLFDFPTVDSQCRRKGANRVTKCLPPPFRHFLEHLCEVFGKGQKQNCMWQKIRI